MPEPDGPLNDDASRPESDGHTEPDAPPRQPARSGGRGFALRQPANEDLVEKGTFWDWFPTAAAFIIIYGVLIFGYYKPGLLFSLTTTSGGDTGAHHYPASYLINELLPHFKLTGWAPGWYAGMPMLTFYFPFPFLLIAILNWFLPYTLAFKFVTVLGVFALPLTVYAFARLLRVRRPFPTIAAVFALIMLLMESYSIYGGNIKSTLAGEFGYMLSFSLVFLWLGTMYRGMEKPKFNMFFVLNSLILMALVLSHIVPTIALVFISPGLLLVNPRWRSLGYLAAVAAIGFGLTAFWSIPFAVELKWTAHMAWDQLRWEGLGGMWLVPVGVPAIVGFLFAVVKREKRLLPLLWMSVVTLIVYWLLPSGRLWNARVVPFWYLSVHLWAAYGITWMIRPFTVWFHDFFGTRGITGRRFFAPVVALAFLIIVMSIPGAAARGWIDWNYSGYEGKDSWSQYQQINNFIGTLGEGRVMVEHNQKIDEFGTPRAFEIIPYWTNMQTMEGTLMEASITAPFHFINQAELSKQASNAIIGVNYPSMNVANGITHMQLMNIEYFLTCTDEVTTATKADSRADLLATFGDYNIFRIAGTTGYAEVMKNHPVTIDIPQPDWRDMAVRWYENMDDLTTPIIWDPNGDPALKEFATITSDQADNPPQVPYTSAGRVVSEKLENEKFSFVVDQATVDAGQPVWIKISYFPNWHVSGAKGPFLVSPSFMVVIPTQTHVVMTYGRTWANTFGQTLEVIAWVILLGLSVWRFILWWRRRRLRGAGGSGVMPVDEFTGQYLDGGERRGGDSYGGTSGLSATNGVSGTSALGGAHVQPGESGRSYAQRFPWEPESSIPASMVLTRDDELERTADDLDVREDVYEVGADCEDEPEGGETPECVDRADAGYARARYEAGDQGWVAAAGEPGPGSDAAAGAESPAVSEPEEPGA